MRGGRVTAELTGDDVTEAAILGAAFGSVARGDDPARPTAHPLGSPGGTTPPHPPEAPGATQAKEVRE
jgi:hypothetical protein